MWINVNGIIQLLLSGNVGKGGYQVIIIRSAGIFGTDRYHPFCTAKIGTDTAHIYGKHFFGIRRNKTSAVSHFLIDCKQQRNFTVQFPVFIPDSPGEAEKDSSRELVIQKTAFDVSTFGNNCAGIHGDDVSGLNAEGQNIFFGGYIFIQQNFHVLFQSFNFLICNMGRWFGV